MYIAVHLVCNKDVRGVGVGFVEGLTIPRGLLIGAFLLVTLLRVSRSAASR